LTRSRYLRFSKKTFIHRCHSWTIGVSRLRVSAIQMSLNIQRVFMGKSKKILH
jgi:hypothetical protein